MSAWVSFFSTIRLTDIVDISLNSYILFRLYVLFRGTTTFRVLLGIAFLWFFQRTAYALGLVLTSWAVQGITAAGALIVIIVFRNEIRSVFQATNLRYIFWGTPGKVYETPVEIIADGIFELARKRIGALFVIPGKDNLDEYLSNGINWQGTLSREMLHAIFFPDNPVHDGAAVIRGDKVERVGVILPLSERDDLPSYFGTRHRAAVGLAERSDALVLLASEERGEVVVAKGRGLEVFYHQVGLEETINSHLGLSDIEEQEEKRHKRDLLLAAVLSVLFITGIWFSITRGSDTLTAMEVPIEYIKNDPEMEIADTSVNTVRLHLSGSSFLIKSIRPGQVRVRVNVNHSPVGKNHFEIRMEDVTLPPGILLKKIEPPELDIVLAKPTIKKIPVQVDWVGRLPDHLIMTRATVKPAEIEMTGQSNLLKNLSTVYTEKISLDDVKKSGKISTRLVFKHPELAPASGDSGAVITYEVKERE